MPSLVRRNPNDKENPYRVGQVIDGEVRCGAKTRSGKPCTAINLMPNGRCRLHGGKTPNGVGLPQTKSGRYSKYLKGDLAESYETALGDPELVQLRDEIALITTRINQLAETVDDNVGDLFWKELKKEWGLFMHAVRVGDTDAQNELLVSLNRTISNGVDERKSWADIERMVDTRRRLVESESRRMQQQQQFLTIEQTIMIATHIIAAIKDASHRYTDPVTARHILVDAQSAYNEILGTAQLVKDSNRQGASPP